MQQESPKKSQPSTAPPSSPSFLVPLVGIPLTLHALAGAAVGGLTFAVISNIFNAAKEKILDVTEPLPPKHRDDF